MIAHKMNSTTKNPELNLVVAASEDQAQSIVATKVGFWSGLAAKIWGQRKPDLNFDEWRRLEYRNEWQEQPNRIMSIHFHH